MLVGNYTSVLDDKNRFRLAKKHKSEFKPDDKLIAIKWPNKSIYIMKTTDFNELILDKVEKNNYFDQNRSDFLRIIGASCVELIEDAQGRFTLPSDLKEYANIEKNIVMIGVFNRIELWDKEEWDNTYKNTSFNKILESIGYN